MPGENIDDLTSQTANAAPQPVGAASIAEPVDVVDASVAVGALVVAAGVPNVSPAAGPEVIHKESRNEHRIHVRWHVDALIEGHIWHGFVRNVSIEGANIFLEHNCQGIKTVKLHIHVPPTTRSGTHHVLDIIAKIIYTAYDSDESLFRSGVKFLKFNPESDSTYLVSCIAGH
jgi:hypothetical protein